MLTFVELRRAPGWNAPDCERRVSRHGHRANAAVLLGNADFTKEAPEVSFERAAGYWKSSRNPVATVCRRVVFGNESSKDEPRPYAAEARCRLFTTETPGLTDLCGQCIFRS